MSCVLILSPLDTVPGTIIAFIRIYNILVALSNILGNALLIFALKRTGQTRKTAFQYIIFMSVSDLVIGSTGLLFITALTYDHFNQNCTLKLATQYILNSCSSFSILMVVLIALDRYLRMKHLERYPSVFTKRRRYYLVTAASLIALSSSALLILPLPRSFHSMLKMTYFSTGIISFLAISILYRMAFLALKKKACQVSGGIINQHKTLGKAAKRVTFCIIVLTAPVIIMHFIEELYYRGATKSSPTLVGCIWFGYITFLGNGFCSSVVLISQNRPVQLFLKRAIFLHLNRVSSFAEKSDREAPEDST